MPSDQPYRISPKQVVSWGWAGRGPTGQTVALSSAKAVCLCQVVPAGGSSTISISFTPLVLGPHVLHKVECVGYALGYMSLDNEVSPPGPRWGHSHCLSPGWHAACSGQRLPVIRLGLGRWTGSFQGGGGVCTTLLWDP